MNKRMLVSIVSQQKAKKKNNLAKTKKQAEEEEETKQWVRTDGILVAFLVKLCLFTQFKS